MKNSVEIWMPFYIGDYLADTQRLTTEQHGAYLLIILDYWRNGPPPLDGAILQSIARLDQRGWKRNEKAILSLFEVRNEHLWQERIERARADAIRNRREASARAATAANARWEKERNSKKASTGYETKDAESNAGSNASCIASVVLDEVPADCSSSSSTSPNTSSPHPISDTIPEARQIGNIAEEFLRGRSVTN